jgi:hypothetical protein
MGSIGEWRSLVSAPALGAGGRRFESALPDFRTIIRSFAMGLAGQKQKWNLEGNSFASIENLGVLRYS